MKAIEEPRMVAARIQGAALRVHGVLALPDRMTPSSQGGSPMFATLSRSAAASGCGGAKAVVGFGNAENHTGALRLVLARHLVRSPENGAEHGDRAASGVVPQTSPDLL